MSKFSVKKPLTVLVAVVAILVLGVVAYLKMTPDLLPNMDFPYVVIMTTYPGASPEKVEEEISKPMEQSMATLDHIKEITSTSSENYSMLLLEFEEDVNMDTIGVDIQQNLSALGENWDESVGTPYTMKINPSMIPVEVAAVSMDGKNVKELTQFLEDTLMNQLEGVTGVARISSSGTVTSQLHVVLDDAKIEEKNAAVQAAVNGRVDEASAELQSQKQELEQAQQELKQAQDTLQSGSQTLAAQTAAGEAELTQQQLSLVETRAELQDQIAALQSSRTQAETAQSVLTALRDGLTTLQDQIEQIRQQLDALLALQQQAAALEAQRAQFSQQLDALSQNSSLTQEEILAAQTQIRQSPEYLAMEAGYAELTARLAAAGSSVSILPEQIAAHEQSLSDLQQRLEELFASLKEEGLTLQTLEEKIEELQKTLAQIDGGIETLQGAVSQLDSGLLQAKDAQQVLSAQKTSGLLQAADAAAQIAANSASLSMGMTQLEAGLDQVEQGREQALASADLSSILTMDTVSALLSAQNFSMPAGYVEQDGVRYMVSVGDTIQDQQELENLVLLDLGIEGLAPIRLCDVAQVMVTDNSAETYAKLNGQDGVVLSFEKQSTYATAEVTANLSERFARLESQYPGLHFVALMDQGDYIHLIIDNILQSLLLGAVLAVLILLLFLKDLRPTFITLCSIPISVIFAVVLMYFSGVTLNMISLSGLAVAVGMLVDNSVVVIENIYRLRAKGANVIQAAVSGTKQVAGAVAASTLTTVCVFLPIVFVEGITRQLFTDLALTMTYSLLASLVIALTLVPAMASGMLRKQKVQKPGLLDRVLQVYRRAVRWAVRHKAVVLGSAALLLVLSALLSIAKGFSFMPEVDMPNVSVTVSMPEDTSMEEAVAYSDAVLEKIGTLDGIETVGATMSSSAMGMLGGSTDSHDVTIYVILSDSSASGAKVGAQIEALCAQMDCEVTASSSMMDMSMLTGSGVSLQLYAEDMQSLQDGAAQAAQALSEVKGLTEISDGLEDATPALHVRVDRDAAMEQGLTVAQVYAALASKLRTSQTAGTLELDGNSMELVLEPGAQSQLTRDGLEEALLDATLQDGSTKTVALGDIATVEQMSSLRSIARLNQRRYLTVSAQVESGYNVTRVTQQAERVMEKTQLPDGVSYAFSGENESIMEAVRQLCLMLLLGILLVYLVMVAQFQSLKSPFIVMFTIPLAFTGGFLALLLCDMEISVISLIGFVMLTGIIVNNGIVLVDYINQLRQEGMERCAAIEEAGVTRMRPILMTSITTILGLIGMALGTNAGTALMQPVAVVCIGGLLYATLMTLFVVPCMYDLLSRKALRKVREEDLQYLDL